MTTSVRKLPGRWPRDLPTERPYQMEIRDTHNATKIQLLRNGEAWVYRWRAGVDVKAAKSFVRVWRKLPDDMVDALRLVWQADVEGGGQGMVVAFSTCPIQADLKQRQFVATYADFNRATLTLTLWEEAVRYWPDAVLDAVLCHELCHALDDDLDEDGVSAMVAELGYDPRAVHEWFKATGEGRLLSALIAHQGEVTVKAPLGGAVRCPNCQREQLRPSSEEWFKCIGCGMMLKGSAL